MNAQAGAEYVEELATRMVMRSPLGEELSEAQCAALGEAIKVRGLKAGDFLFQEGEKDDTVYVVASGKLEVMRAVAIDDWITLHVLREGEMTGELGFVDGLEHSASLRALTDCEVFSLDRASLEALLGADPDLVYQVMRAIIRTVHTILRRMNVQHVEMSNYITKRSGRY